MAPPNSLLKVDHGDYWDDPDGRHHPAPIPKQQCDLRLGPCEAELAMND
jgi:hypothetical protein